MGCLFISSTHGMTFIRQLLPIAYGMNSSFLRDRSMANEVDGVTSAPCYLSPGVPQEWVSTVFSMFINDFCSCIRFSKYHSYANDLQIYLSGIWMRRFLHSMRTWQRFLDGRLRMGCF
jgi:hypothetical protein